MADVCSVANDNPLVRDCVVETRFGQGSPQVGVAIPPECSRRHKVVQSFYPKAGIFLWGAVFAAASIPSCMLALGMFIRWRKSLEIVGCVVPVVPVFLSMIQPWRGN